VSTLVLALLLAPPAPADAFDTHVTPFVKGQCVSCHNPQLKQGELDLLSELAPESVAKQPELWEKVVLRLKTGEMPPPPMRKPAETELLAVTRAIEAELERAALATPPDPGRVTARRLNRAEYDNTLRDLLGLELGLADDFPPDDSGYGFDNIGDVLSLSPALLERYVAAAERASRAAVFGLQDLKPTATRHTPVSRRIKNQAKPLFEYDVTGLGLNSVHAVRRFPADGEYRIRVILGGQRPAGSMPVTVGLWLDGERLASQQLDPETLASFANHLHDFAGMMREFKVRIPAGEHWVAGTIERLYEGLPADYEGPNPSTRKVVAPEFKPPPNASPERIAEMRKGFEARLKERPAANGVRVNALEIGGPYELASAPDPERQRRLFVCGHLDGKHKNGCDRKILASLARRAFRRPVTPRELDGYVKLAAEGRRGGSFEQGLALAVQGILVSPDFLFRIEGATSAGAAAGAASVQVTDHELASRLSYFLWSSMPDEALLAAADASSLKKPDVLEAQVRRMLRDPKTAALVQNFGGQWLQFRALESAKPDLDRFPEFDDYLRFSMRRETELFLGSIVKDDASIAALMDAKYTFVNERLARHYGIGGVGGPEFRRVATAGLPRAGVLGHASVLTVSSYSTRTSPVLRGKWILSNLLGAPPPDPPAGTPRLDEKTVGKDASLRQQLEAHRTDATCAACHSRMDPLGFGLENYDAVGGWREKDGTFAIDASGALPDGRRFGGPAELAGLLQADRDEFALAFTGKLLTYSLGRGLERYDRPTVKQIAVRAREDDYRFSRLVLEVARSLPFQSRRAEQKP
jgi:hypothetical protein